MLIVSYSDIAVEKTQTKAQVVQPLMSY